MVKRERHIILSRMPDAKEKRNVGHSLKHGENRLDAAHWSRKYGPPAHEVARIEQRAAAVRGTDRKFSSWAEGYGPVRHGSTLAVGRRARSGLSIAVERSICKDCRTRTAPPWHMWWMRRPPVRDVDAAQLPSKDELGAVHGSGAAIHLLYTPH